MESPESGSAEALAKKTASYTKNLEQMLAQAAPVTPAPAQPSEVEWLDESAGLFLSAAPYRQEDATQSESAEPEVQPVAIIEPATAASVLPQSTPDQAAPAQPLSSVESSNPAGADALQQQLRQRVASDPRDLASHLDYQLLQFVQSRQVPDLASLAPLPMEDREVLTAVLDGLSNFRSAVRADQNMLLSRKIKPLVAVADRLRSQADLNIPRVALCTRVTNFGVYDAIEPARFPQGTGQWVIVYCEVENFSSQLTDGGNWQTELTQDLALYMENGFLVWQDKTQQVSDLCRNRRRDFFVYRKVLLPMDQLTVGRYLLKVSIVDRQSNRVAESTVPIQVVAQQAVE